MHVVIGLRAVARWPDAHDGELRQRISERILVRNFGRMRLDLSFCDVLFKKSKKTGQAFLCIPVV